MLMPKTCQTLTDRLYQRLSDRRGSKQFQRAVLNAEPHIRAELLAAAERELATTAAGAVSPRVQLRVADLSGIALRSAG